MGRFSVSSDDAFYDVSLSAAATDEGEKISITFPDLERSARSLLGHPNIASKRWIHEQYDTQVQTQTLQRPGGSAAVLQLKGSDKKVALTTDCNGLFCYLDPREGAKMAVAEAARNVVCAGATPLAITNCLNFGNPNKPEVFWQFSEAIAGMGEACRVLGTPVTGGNVSFYNQNPEGAIFPTPVIGMVGLIEEPARSLTPHFKVDGHELWLIGADPRTLGGSQYAQLGSETPVGPCPVIDLEFERLLLALILKLNGAGLIETAHDLSEGGLFITAAEGSLGGRVGCRLDSPPAGIEPALWLFSEDPSRVLVSVKPESSEALQSELSPIGINARRVGTAGGDSISFADRFSIPLPEAHDSYYREP